MKMDARPPILEADRLAVEVGRHKVCRDLDFTLQPGDTLVILGRNGAGKSTLLHTLAGLREPVGGAVLLSGQPYAAWPRGHEACLRGLLAQSQPDFFSATVLETALVGRHPYLGRWDWETPDDEAIAMAALEQMGLAALAGRQVPTLSGGERQRLSIAALLVQQPRLYLLDEPLAHLDLNHQIAILNLFAGAAQDCHAGLVMVLHEPGLADRYCDRALLVHGDGRCELGACRELLTAERLGSLYGLPLKEVVSDDRRWFIPV